MRPVLVVTSRCRTGLAFEGAVQAKVDSGLCCSASSTYTVKLEAGSSEFATGARRGDRFG